MANFDPNPGDLLFMIVCAGGPTTRTVERLEAELADNQRVRVIATPQAAEWLDHDRIEQLTGWPLQSKMLTPEASTLVPMGNRVLATPVTLNTLTKWADGHADNLAIGLLCEALGSGIPIRAELSLSQPFANHPAVPGAIARLDAAPHVTFNSHPAAPLTMDDITAAMNRANVATEATTTTQATTTQDAATTQDATATTQDATATTHDATTEVATNTNDNTALGSNR